MHAPHWLRVREQRAPAARVAIFSPSVCLSAVGFVRLQRRPSAHRHRLGPQLPSACRGPVPESPGLAGPSCSPGPIVRRSVCPEAGPRDPERRGAPRRRVKKTPDYFPPGPGRGCGGPSPPPLPGPPAVGLLSASGEGTRGSQWPGAGAAQAPTHPLPRFPETRRDPGSSPGSFLFAPLWRGRDVGAAARPARAQVGLAGAAGTAPASDRREELGEDGRGRADPGIGAASRSRRKVSKFRSRRRLCCLSRLGRPLALVR